MNNELPKTEVAEPVKKAPVFSSCLAVLLGIALVLFTLLGLIGFNIWRVLFDPIQVKQALTSQIVTSDAVPTFLEIFSEWRAEQRLQSGEALSGVSEPDIVLLISYMDREDWRQIKQLLVTDEFVTNLISVSVDGIYHWIDSDELLPGFTWDLSPLKANLAGPQGLQALMVAYSAMPVCSEAEIQDLKQRMAEAPPGVSVLYNLCQFPEPWRTDQIGDYVESLNGVNVNVPIRFDLHEMLAGNPSAAAMDPTFIKTQLRLVSLVARWTWLAALLVLLLILLIRVRSLRSLGQFVGIPLFISGVLAILFTWGGQFVLIQFIRARILATTSPLITQEVSASLKQLTSFFFQPMLIQSIILTGLGFVLILLIFIKKPQSET